MCGLSDRGKREEPKAEVYNGTYTPPDLREAYAQFKATGRVPYSNYGAGAPTRPGELEAVRRAYPGSFQDPPPAPPSQQGPQADRRINPFSMLFDTLSRRAKR